MPPVLSACRPEDRAARYNLAGRPSIEITTGRSWQDGIVGADEQSTPHRRSHAQCPRSSERHYSTRHESVLGQRLAPGYEGVFATSATQLDGIIITECATILPSADLSAKITIRDGVLPSSYSCTPGDRS